MDEALLEAVRQRADHRCEYCHIMASQEIRRLEIDHTIARQHEGPTILSNLALACLHCNSHKGTNLTGIDPVTRKLARLFHPRRHKWHRHFRWDGPYLIALSAVGRATIAVLKINDPLRVNIRQSHMDETD